MGSRHKMVVAIVTFVLAMGLLGVQMPNVAGAQEHPPVTLTRVSDSASWSGEFVAGAVGVWPVVSLPEACTPELCDIVPLDVQLPERTWQHRPGGMLVAIQMPGLDGYSLDLFVYGPDGTQVASSDAPLHNEAAWVANPINGRYTVKVVPRAVVGPPNVDDVLEPARYDGFVRFQRGLTVQRDELVINGGVAEDYTREFVAFGLNEAQPAVELLPDLVPTTPRNFSIAFPVRGVRLPSCLPTETLGEPDDGMDPGDRPLRCLRFDLGEYNFGDGPFQLNIYEVEPDVLHVYQRIYSSDGSARQIGPLGDVEFHDSHAHFHYLGFQEVTLHRIEDDGSLTFVQEWPNKGFCMVDIEMGRFGRTDRPTGPLGYPILSQCFEFRNQDPDDPTFPDQPFVQMGISVGWADVYPTIQPDQYIDITDVPDGDHALVVRQDVDHQILEKSTRNNTAMGCVRISNNGGTAHDIPCDAVR